MRVFLANVTALSDQLLSQLAQVDHRDHEALTAAGTHCLIGLCLASNDAIVRLLSRLGPMTTSPPAAGVVEVRIDLRPARNGRHARRAYAVFVAWALDVLFDGRPVRVAGYGKCCAGAVER